MVDLLAPTQHAPVVRIPLVEIDPNPAQPRRLFDPQGLFELAGSIAENGLLCPVSVRQMPDGRYQLIAGERRLMAYRLLGEETIPALVEQADDQRAAILALVENLQRRNLNFLEESKAIAKLIQTQGLTQRQAAQKLGVAQPTLANKLRVLRLPLSVLTQLAEGG